MDQQMNRGNEKSVKQAQQPKDTLVLLFSYSFPDGVIVTETGYKHFCGAASELEAANAVHYTLPHYSGLIEAYEYVTDHEVAGHILVSLEAH